MSKESVKTALAIKRRRQLGIHALFPRAICSKLRCVENISYAGKLFIPDIEQFKDFHTSQYEVEIFDKVLDSLKQLWTETYGLNKCFEIFEKYVEFEPILFKNPRYRDHFIHQYLVFLTGLPILDRFKPIFASKLTQVAETKRDLIDIEKTWLLTSTYHDIGYPIERFENWLSFFFVEFLKMKENPVSIGMSRILVERDYLSYLHTLSEFAFQVYKDVNPMLEKKDLFRLIVKGFLKRNHGVVSSLMLLDNYNAMFGPDSGVYSKDVFNAQVLPSALAIALHAPNIWSTYMFPHIPFERDPITFLLIYCDAVQEWGRPSLPHSVRQSPYIPLITDFEINDRNVSMTLSYDIVEEVKLPNGSQSTTFDLKKRQISSVMDKLKCSALGFEVILKSDDEEYGLEQFRKTCRGN